MYYIEAGIGLLSLAGVLFVIIRMIWQWYRVIVYKVPFTGAYVRAIAFEVVINLVGFSFFCLSYVFKILYTPFAVMMLCWGLPYIVFYTWRHGRLPGGRVNVILLTIIVALNIISYLWVTILQLFL